MPTLTQNELHDISNQASGQTKNTEAGQHNAQTPRGGINEASRNVHSKPAWTKKVNLR